MNDINNPFTKLKTISELEETFDPINGDIPIDKGGGDLMRIKSSVFTQLIGNVAKPISPTDVTPTIVGWYKPQVASELDKPTDPNSTADWGAKYPNAGNLRAKSGYDTLFFFGGTGIWKKVEVKMGFVFDVSGGALSYEAAKVMLDGFMHADITKPVKTTLIPQSSNIGGGKFLKLDNTIFSDSTYPNVGVVYNFPVGSATKFRINNLYNSQTGPTFAPVTGRKKDGTAGVLMQWTDPNISGEHIFDVSNYETVSVQTWAPAAWPTLELQEFSNNPYIDVKNYIDDLFQVMDWLVHPYDVTWEEITMPYPGEVDNQAMGSNFIPLGGAGFAYGLIPIAAFDGFDQIKIEGGLDKFTGFYLWGQNSTTGVKEGILQGQKTGSYTFDLNKTKYKEYGYTRYKSLTKIYKGKKVKKPIEKDSLRKFILENSGGSIHHRGIDAYLEFGVSNTNTASQNSSAINAAIEAAHAQKKPLYLPAGTIKIAETITWIQDVPIFGAGMRKTILLSTMAVPAIKSISSVIADDPYFSLPVGGLHDMTIEGGGIGTIGVEVRNIANGKSSNLLIMGFTEWAWKSYGLLIYTFDHVYFQACENGIYLNKSNDSGYGEMQANLINFNRCNFLDLKRIGVEITNGAMFTFVHCSIGGTGIIGDSSTGFLKAYNLSPLNEGVDITFITCWSEQMKGGFWISLLNCKGTTTFYDTMLWDNLSNCERGIINNGSRVNLYGGSYAKGFKTMDIQTTNNGLTLLDGSSYTINHMEATGGALKKAVYQ